MARLLPPSPTWRSTTTRQRAQQQVVYIASTPPTLSFAVSIAAFSLRHAVLVTAAHSIPSVLLAKPLPPFQVRDLLHPEPGEQHEASECLLPCRPRPEHARSSLNHLHLKAPAALNVCEHPKAPGAFA